MRKIILFIASSLDGFIARRDGDVSWLFMDADYGYRKFYGSVDTVMMGRKTYEKALELGDSFKGKKCFVFSRKLKGKKGNAEFVDNPVAFTKQLIKSKGRNIWVVGGTEIISVLLNHDLIDEIVLSVHPIILGRGIPLFSKVKSAGLKLVKSKSYKSGLVQLHYEIIRLYPISE